MHCTLYNVFSNILNQVFAWHHVRKNLDQWQVRNYKYSRGVSGEDVTRILFEDIVLNKNPARALDRVLQLSALNKYYTMLDSERERNDFRRHAAKYINIWLPDCAFEVSFTNRYMVDQWEAKTTARKFIKTGDRIKYLCGELVQISLEDEGDEKFIENAFSITYSSRRKTPSLFLGPARFSNHDCNANAKLESRGSEGMLVIAVRDIEVGDEINVHYGDNYFGEDNCECLCASCEKYGQGAWLYGTGEDGTRTPRAGSEEANDPGSRRSKRKRNIVDYKQRLREANTRMDEEGSAKRRKAEVEYNGRAEEWTPTPETRDLHHKLHGKHKDKAIFKAATEPAHARTAAMLALVGRSALPPKTPATIKSEYERSLHGSRWEWGRRSTSDGMEGPPKSAYYKSHMLFAFLKREPFDEERTYKPKALQPPMSALPSVEVETEHSQDSAVSSEEASIFDVDHVERHSASPVTEPPSTDDSAVEPELIDITSHDDHSQDSIVTPKKRGRPPKSPLGDPFRPSSLVKGTTEIQRNPQELQEDTEPTSPEALTTAAEPVQPIAVTELTTAKSTDLTSSKPLNFDNKSPSSPTQSKADTAHRVPGDYLRTSRLLGPKNSRWVDCRTCDEVFIQHDSNQTRRECPRCERHSKLYGFQWPQTDYERGDSKVQKRVMDHRTVNRYLSRAEEMEVSKRGRGCIR